MVAIMVSKYHFGGMLQLPGNDIAGPFERMFAEDGVIERVLAEDGIVNHLAVKDGPLEHLAETAEILSRLQPGVEALTPTADTLESAVDGATVACRSNGHPKIVVPNPLGLAPL